MMYGTRLKFAKLSWWFRRRLTGASHGVGGLRGHRVKPSTGLMIAAALIFVSFILAGGMYDLTENPITLLPTSSGGYNFLIPGSLSQQTINESLAAWFMYALGIGGLYLLLRSTRSAYRPRSAYLLLVLGTLTILLVVWYSNALILAKISSG